jgi:hypothetical protein
LKKQTQKYCGKKKFILAQKIRPRYFLYCPRSARPVPEVAKNVRVAAGPLRGLSLPGLASRGMSPDKNRRRNTIYSGPSQKLDIASGDIQWKIGRVEFGALRQMSHWPKASSKLNETSAVAIASLNWAR